MSPLGRALLRLCNDDLSIRLEIVTPFFPYLTARQIKLAALMIGLRIEGGS